MRKFIACLTPIFFLACVQTEKKSESRSELPNEAQNQGQAGEQKDGSARDVASTEAPNDFEPNRYHFTGTGADLLRELKLMRGNLERSKVLGVSTDRSMLLSHNLFDTGTEEAAELDCKRIMALDRDDFVLHHRTADGLCYMHKQGQFLKAKTEADLSHLKRMGAKGARFGRNTKPPTKQERELAEASVLEPNPVVLSQTFFNRKKDLSPRTDGFHPVPWVNLLATAWLQAENHDWFTHGKNVDLSHIPAGDQALYRKMYEPYQIDGFIIPRTRPDLSFLNGQLAAKLYDAAGGAKNLENFLGKYGRKYRNYTTHWWDASHIYGGEAETIRRVRTIPSGVSVTDSAGQVYEAGQLYPDGKIAVDEKNRKLYYRPDPTADNEVLPITGFHDNWWIGLEMIHGVFALEHNKVVDHLKAEFEKKSPNDGEIYRYYHSIKSDPEKRGDFLFNKARLVISALIAKIHTVEWTPSILDNPGMRMGMFANWNGFKTVGGDPEAPAVRKWIDYMMGRSARMLISGLTGEGTLNLFKVPFSLTEEFVSVYRMHSLLSDNINVRQVARGDSIQSVMPVNSTRDGEVESLLGNVSSADWMYSFGRDKAGLMTLHNYPKFMEYMEVRRNVEGQKKDQPIRMNMGAVDLVRDRERQIPRYNNFRRSLRLRPIKKFTELFITSRVLYEDATQQPAAYREVIEKLRAQIKADKAKYDIPMIERNLSKIPEFSVWDAAKNLKNAGIKGVLDDGKNLVSEDVFYNYYFALPLAEQQALLNQQEIEDIANMERLYKGNVEMLDLLVGTLAEEDRYDRFGFGNTPFFIFALMASRRLMSDPFFSDLYTDEVYSAAGKAWVEKTSMVDVIVRNFPELKPKFKDVKNAFHPWNPN